MSKENSNSIFTLLDTVQATPLSLRLFILTEAIKLPYSIYRGRITVKDIPGELVVDYGVMKFAEMVEPLLR
jgi:hypothetical protein